DHSRFSAVVRLSCCASFGLAAAIAATTPSAISLATSANPASLGQTILITATVTAGATGKVTFYEGASILGIAGLNSGLARLSTSLLFPGIHSLRAHYSGDATFLPSNSAILPQGVATQQANTFQQVVTTLSQPAQYQAAAAADFNGDGKTDLLLTQ